MSHRNKLLTGTPFNLPNMISDKIIANQDNFDLHHDRIFRQNFDSRCREC